MTGEERLERLRLLKKEALLEGGPEQAAARRKNELLSARERVLGVLDPGTFVELDVLVDGVVTGHGKVNGRDVYLFSQDGDQTDDYSRERFAQKTVKVVDLAMKNGAPVIGIHDAGERWSHDAGLGALGAYADIFFRNVMASGVVPQIAAIMGQCGGAAAYSPALADFTLMVKGSGQLFLAGPEAARAVSGEDATIEELGGGRTHSETTGIAHLAADDEAACLGVVRELLSYLPQNNLEDAPRTACADPADRRDAALEQLMLAGGDDQPGYDVRDLVGAVVDDRRFLELQAGWAKNLVVGFARLNGRAVGVVANQPAELAGRIDIDAAVKGARFVRTCDAFNLPLLTFVDTPGFVPGKAQERAGLLRDATKLLYAFCEASVPKLTVVTGKAYGEAYEVMASKHIRADFNLAWPSAEIAASPSASGDAVRRWEAHSPITAAKRGYLDDVIEPGDTRPRLIAALEACASKREGRPPKKHGNIPL